MEKIESFFESENRVIIFGFSFVALMFIIMGASNYNSYLNDVENSYTFEAEIIKASDGVCLVENGLDDKRFSIYRGQCGGYIVGDTVLVKFFDYYYTVVKRI